MNEHNEVVDTNIPYDSDSDPAWDAVGFGEEVDGWEAEESYDEDFDSTPEADQPAEEESGAEDHDEAEDADQWLELKHMDDPVRKVSKEEAKALAQKGLDYDRIRGERDGLLKDLSKFKDYESFLNELKGDFDTIDDLIDDTRARVLSEKEEISYNAALSRIKSGRKTASGSGAVEAFVKKYPGVKAEDIPAGVWEEVRQTGDLVGAYEKHLDTSDKSKDARIKALEEEIEILKNNKNNESRSTGSSKSKGNTSRASMIASLWNEDD